MLNGRGWPIAEARIPSNGSMHCTVFVATESLAVTCGRVLVIYRIPKSTAGINQYWTTQKRRK